MSRPIGVSILSALVFLNGIFMLIGGIVLFYYGPMIAPLIIAKMKMPVAITPSMVKSMITVGSIFGIVGGIVAIIVAIGLWFGMNWAWWIFVVFSVITLVSSIVNIAMQHRIDSVIVLVIEIIVLAYITRPHVRAYFKES